MNSHQVFVENVRRVMREKSLTNAEVARRLGQTASFVQQYIGRVRAETPIEQLPCPTLVMIDRFALALEVSPESLLHDEELVAA